MADLPYTAVTMQLSWTQSNCSTDKELATFQIEITAKRRPAGRPAGRSTGRLLLLLPRCCRYSSSRIPLAI